MKTHYQPPQASLLFADASDILTISTHDIANINEYTFDSIDGSKLF